MTTPATRTTRSTILDATPKVPASTGSQTPAPASRSATPNDAPPERAQTSPAAIAVAEPNKGAPQGTTTSRPTMESPTPSERTSAGTTTSPQAIDTATSIPRSPAGSILQLIDDSVEADPAFLSLLADVVDDLERVRIANDNRLRQLLRGGPEDGRLRDGKYDSVDDLPSDKDGEKRGLGLDSRNLHVRRITSVVAQIAAAEHDAVLALQNLMRKHPLGPWVKAQKGIGEKQAARLLAVIGDPYIRPELTHEDGTVEPSRPRTVSELWAYCGYHVTSFPADHSSRDTQSPTVGGDQTGHPDHPCGDAQSSTVGVAPKRQRGDRANWSTLAKTRTYNVANKAVQAGVRKLPSVDDSAGYDLVNRKATSPLGQVYLDTRAKYADALHKAPCVRCGPKGKPAPAGSPLSDGHKHARAMRAVSKEILKELWREARRLHTEESGDVS